MKHLHWTKSVLLAAAVLALVALPIAAQRTTPAAGSQSATGGAQTGDMAQGMLAGHIHAMVKQLNLSQDQMTAAHAIFQDVHTQAQPIHQQQKALHDQLATALKADNPDPAAVGQLVIQSHQLRQQMKPIFEAADQKFQALLTPDQLTKYQAIKASHGDFLKMHAAGMGH